MDYDKGAKSHEIHVYVDASWDDDLLTRRSTNGILV